jgi:uncharacterized protein with HEPN domain
MQRDALLLAEMIDAAERIVSIVADASVEDLERDRTLRESLLWNIAVLGEAAGELSQEVKVAHPEVEWSNPVRLRNRIVHGYWSIDLDILYSTGRDDIPRFCERCVASRVVPIRASPAPIEVRRHERRSRDSESCRRRIVQRA